MKRRAFNGFVIPLVLALLTSLVVFQIVSSHEQDFIRVNETSIVSAQLNALIKIVVDAETSERGFVITGDQRYLEPYFSSTTDFGVTLTALRGSLTDSASRETLDKIDALHERWYREVAEVVIGARKQAPVGLDNALRGASTAFTEAHVAALRYQLTNETPQLNRSDLLLGEVERQLERALSLSISGSQRTAARAAAVQVERYRRDKEETGRAALLERAQTLNYTLAQLATDAETAEAEVTVLIFAGTGKRLVDEIRTLVADLAEGVNTTLERTLVASNAATQRTQWLAFFGPLFASLVSLLAIVQSQRRLGRSIRELAAAARGFAEGQLGRRLSLGARDELRPLAEDFNLMANRLSEREQQNAQLGQFSSTLQSCTTTVEAYGATERFAPQLFGAFSGALYRISNSRNLLEEVARWGDEAGLPDAPQVHTPSDCWALRRGSPQTVDGARGMICLHAHTPAPPKSLCTPLITQNEPLGLLYLYSSDPETDLNGATERFVGTVAEQLALALSNLRLRESLRQQSIRDPLTGLYNRRHLEETLELELHRAARRNEPVSVVMFDVDHFKRYNDTYGHDAGDTVLRALSDVVKRHIRAGDLAYRVGGEEFLLLQPGMAATDAVKRAETLREAAAAIAFSGQGGALGGVTISLGVATYPDHAQRSTDLLKRADEALYQAKRGGRNRTVVTGSAREGAEPVAPRE